MKQQNKLKNNQYVNEIKQILYYNYFIYKDHYQNIIEIRTNI